MESNKDNRQSAFDLMMASSKAQNTLPDRYNTENMTKDRLLFNDIVDWLKGLGLGWQNQRDADDVGKKLITHLRDALWLVDGHWVTLDARGLGVPSPLQVARHICTGCGKYRPMIQSL